MLCSFFEVGLLGWLFVLFLSVYSMECSVRALVKVGEVLSPEVAHSLVLCPYCVTLHWKRVDGSFRSWNRCTVDCTHCEFHRKRVRFKSRFQGLEVAWICPKLVGLPVLESVNHG